MADKKEKEEVHLIRLKGVAKYYHMGEDVPLGQCGRQMTYPQQ